MKDLQVAIANYYADKAIDPIVSIKPSVEELPSSANEGDCRECQNIYYIFDNGKWNELNVGNTDADFEFAEDNEVIDMLKQGEELANG